MANPYTRVKLTEVEDSAPKFGYEELQEARFATGDLAAEDTGISHMRIRPGKRQGFAHRHDAAEEIYVLVAGAGCVGCSSIADGIPQLGLLHSRDITFAMVSPAPQEKLRGYAERMGWSHIPWYTIRTERFSSDFGVDEWFGFNVFLRDGDDIYRTYFLQNGRMVQQTGSIWTLFNLTPYGGQSEDEDAPEGWPQAPDSFWFRRHDEFYEPAPSATAGESSPKRGA